VLLHVVFLPFRNVTLAKLLCHKVRRIYEQIINKEMVRNQLLETYGYLKVVGSGE